MLNWAGLEAGSLHFVNSRLNSLTFAGGQLIPIAILLRLFRGKRNWMSEVGCGAVLPVGVLAAILFLFAFAGAFASNADIEEGCRLLCSVSMGDTQVRGYRTNGGALESYNVLIQQERTVLPGIIWTTRLYYADPAGEASLTVIDRHHVRCSIPRYGPGEPENPDIVLRVD